MKQTILRIAILFLAAIFIGSSVINHRRNQIVSDAKEYLNAQYPNLEVAALEVPLNVDSIQEVVFEDQNTKFVFSVYLTDNKTYDNYLRSKLEAQMKMKVLPLLNNIKEKHITLFLDVSFEKDHLLQHYINEKKLMNYTLSIDHKGAYDHHEISLNYSELAHKVFNDFDNIDNVIIKNYDKSDKELYLFINRSELMDITADTIKAYILEQEIFYKK